MHNLLARANAIFAFSLTVLGVLAFCLYATTIMYPQNGSVKLDSSRVAVKHMTEYNNGKTKNDIGFLNFDLLVDLEPLFNWNVKQLFLYLTAEYETEDNVLNQVVIWDKIVQKGDNYKLDLRNSRTKYNLWDDGNGLRGHKNVTTYLSWNIIPNVGSLPKIMANGAHQIAFPAQYSSHSA